MERIKPSSLDGPRAYFTDFDYEIVRLKHDKRTYRKEIERKLKVLFLTKNEVVCASSHMTHEFTYGLFKDNPVLLADHMILPALRDDKKHVVDYLGERNIKKTLKQDMLDFYGDKVSKVVSWELIDNSLWFKETLLKELKNENSVIRRNLTGMDLETLASIISRVESHQILFREALADSISTLPKGEKRIMQNFTNLIYHMSGARVVNCESALPQENYIDYSLTDISKRMIILSETQIFWKVFLELAFETMLKRNIPIELLDLLTFEDIHYLRKPIEKSSFRKTYDNMIQKSMQVVERNNPDEVLLDAYELMKIKDHISEGFKEIFDQQLPEFLKKKRIGPTKELRKSSLSLALGLVGFVPGVSSVTGLLDLLRSSREFCVNLNQIFRCRREVNDYNLYIRNKEKMLHKMIETSSFSDKSELLEVVSLLVNSISSRMMM